MLGFEKPENLGEIKVLLGKCEKRKGRSTPLGQCAHASIIRMEGHMLTVRRSGEGESETFTLYDAWDYCYAVARVGSVYKSSKVAERVVTLLTRPGEVLEPRRKPPVKSYVTSNADGSVCCQNVIHGLMGDHFRFASRQDYESFRAEDEKNGPREWFDQEGSCSCGREPRRNRRENGNAPAAPAEQALDQLPGGGQ